MPDFPFSAVLLAGGRSQRMGQDKAGLLWQGEPLWQHQLATLRALAPAELFLSGTPGHFAGHETVPDELPGHGPLGGLVAGLRRARTPWLVVLAIDLPLVPAELLTRLLALAWKSGAGVVPRGPRGYEPLAAIYPHTSRPLAETALAQGRRALQPFVEALLVAGLAAAYEIPPAEEPLFANPNTPAEWSALTGSPPASRSAPPPSSGR